MFERFTEQARRTLFFARYEAGEVGVQSIETEHLLLGLLREGKGLTSDILARFHLSRDEIRKEIMNRAEIREKFSTSAEIPFSTETMSAMQAAAEEAGRLLHPYIGTEHLLLGILRQERSVAGSILTDRGMQLEAVREEIARLTNPSIQMEIEQSDARSEWSMGATISMTARHRTFESRSSSWKDLCDEAAAFATEIGPEKVISISVAASAGLEMPGHGGPGVIVVWYWE
jgi:ATP-dependent Clp protease ATP-binding subunit ClpC